MLLRFCSIDELTVIPVVDQGGMIDGDFVKMAQCCGKSNIDTIDTALETKDSLDFHNSVSWHSQVRIGKYGWALRMKIIMKQLHDTADGRIEVLFQDEPRWGCCNPIGNVCQFSYHKIEGSYIRFHLFWGVIFRGEMENWLHPSTFRKLPLPRPRKLQRRNFRISKL